jgi:hypothetical protein
MKKRSTLRIDTIYHFEPFGNLYRLQRNAPHPPDDRHLLLHKEKGGNTTDKE